MLRGMRHSRGSVGSLGDGHDLEKGKGKDGDVGDKKNGKGKGGMNLSNLNDSL